MSEKALYFRSVRLGSSGYLKYNLVSGKHGVSSSVIRCKVGTEHIISFYLFHPRSLFGGGDWTKGMQLLTDFIR